MPLTFGTDGVRGVAGRDLTPELVTSLGRSAARVLGVRGRPFVVGRDTRLSGPMLQAALSAGMAAEGFDVVDLGVLPTPAVAAAGGDRNCPAAVVSASHNPFQDNGVKLFAAGGRKLSDEAEAEIEAGLHAEPSGLSGAALGTLETDPTTLRWYLRHVVSHLDGRSLSDLPVVLDCGHGAAVATASPAFSAAGASVVDLIGGLPDGTNINAGCGSTDPSGLARAVLDHRAAAGLAFDGDADRVIAVDEQGRVVDGDRLLALFAVDLHERGRLAGDAVAVTVMTNLGFHQAMAAAGIKVAQTPVGDRYVLEALDANGWSLGGEQSGHIVFRDLANTGDGVLSGLLLCDLLRRSGRPLSELADAAMTTVPQVLLNVPVADHSGLSSEEAVWAAVRKVEEELGAGGRVLLRASGTEKLVRVMVEAASESRAREAAERLAAVVADALGRRGG